MPVCSPMERAGGFNSLNLRPGLFCCCVVGLGIVCFQCQVSNSVVRLEGKVGWAHNRCSSASKRRELYGLCESQPQGLR